MFDAVASRMETRALEDRVLKFWKDNDIFHKSVEQRPADRVFSFYEGPPTANGRPGVHHVLSRVFKDVIPRYRTMRGYRVPRKAGWDTHGLPVELEIERELGLSSKSDIERFGIEEFNRRCRASVEDYVGEWNSLTERIAFWVDLDDAYWTFTPGYVESCWWILKSLWDAGLVYQDYRSTPHCPRCGTSLSDHEVAQGYRDDTPDPSVAILFRALEGPASLRLADGVPTYLMAWTTTPWTLPGNVALAVLPSADYSIVEVERDGRVFRVVLAGARRAAMVGDAGTVVGSVTGADLVDVRYEALYRAEQWGVDVMTFEGGRLARLPGGDERAGLRRVIGAEFVSMDDGSGIVHIAPSFGTEDFEIGKELGLLFIQPVDTRGLMPSGSPFGALFVKEADPLVIADLRERGQLWSSGTIHHTYPFCWRCGTPLLYYAKPSWYIRTTAVKDELIAGNERVNWYPEHIKQGRFGDWLRNNIDWALSRERYWGTPLPVWRCTACGEDQCVGSFAELVEKAVDPERARAVAADPHRPYVDDVALRCAACGGEARRVPDVADAWFDSGAMPYAQWHYPFENQEIFAERFPADFISEAVDQTRGWFYTLHAEATLLHHAGKIPEGICFRNVICLGHILDANGEKMSKSKGNVVQPIPVLDEHGADALRWYLLTASAAGQPRRFSSDLVGEAVRRFLLTLWNTYSFFVTYANIDGFTPAWLAPERRPELDRWILSELHTLAGRVTDDLEAYEPTDGGREIAAFVENLSNWYVRRSRRRFWKGTNDADKAAAYHTLYECLVTLSKLLAPYTPFVAEEIYRTLVLTADPAAPESVHLADWPVPDAAKIDEKLQSDMRLVMRLASAARAARAKAQLKVRQPLQALLVKTRSAEEQPALQALAEHLQEELNVKELAFIEDETSVLSYDVKPNLPVLGPKYGADLGKIRAAVQAADPTAVGRAVRSGQSVELAGFRLDPDELLVTAKDSPGYATAQEAGYTVALSTELTPELEAEGLVREVVHRLQNTRKNAGLDIADHIVAYLGGDPATVEVLRRFDAYTRDEALADDVRYESPPEGVFGETQEIEGRQVVLGVVRV
ncbi:MAG: isoleucine--tRNA ligase [Polyangiaceae bacterium]|nr:isoleucine--tRNA ligase [Polyangiaceae bacterium]